MSASLSFEIVTTTAESSLPETSDDDIECIAVEMVDIVLNSRSSELREVGHGNLRPMISVYAENTEHLQDTGKNT